MKKGRRIAAILLCVLLTALLCVGCGKKAENSEKFSEEELVSNDTQSLVYKNGSYTLRFFKNEEGDWQWKDDTTLPLDQNQVQQLLDQVAALNELTPLETPKDIETYDLDAPDRTLDITNTDGTGISLQIGVAAEGGGYYMCRDADTSKVYVAPDALVQLMDRSIYELVKLPSVPTISTERLSIIQVVDSDGTEKMAVQNEGGRWLSEGRDVTETLTAVLALLNEGNWIESCVDYNPSKGALPVCGLDDPQAVVTVTYKDAGGNVGTMTVKVGLAYKSGYYICYNDVPAIFKVSSDTASTICGLLQMGA